MLNDVPDHTAAAGAVRLAERIAAYWRNQGSASRLRVWVEPIWGGTRGRKPAAAIRMREDLAVRSNLVGGLPPRDSA